MNIKEWGLPKKIGAGVILLILIWIIWGQLFGVNQATQEILDLPEGTLDIVNNDGEEITINIKQGTSATTFADVDPEVIAETVIYHASPFPASAARVFAGAEVSYEVARFDAEGRILEIYEISANTDRTINPDERYQHTLMAPEGFFAENNISVENGSTIQ